MHTSSEAILLLENSTLFSGVQRNLITETINSSGRLQLKTGDKLLVPGQSNHLVYVVLSGRLSIQLEQTGFNPISMVGAGECVGEMSMLNDGQASAFVVAATDCELLTIDHSALWYLIDNSHEAAHNMLRLLSQRIRVSDKYISENLEHQHGFQGAEMIDELTGLYNRKWMSEKILRYLQRASVNNQTGSLILLSMDNYPDFAEKHGILGADQALRTIAHTMLSCLRPDDQAGHHADHQFVIFLPNTKSLADALRAADRLRIAVSQANVVLPSGDALPHITISLGVSLSGIADSLPNLYARAETALLVAQGKGGNCVECGSEID